MSSLREMANELAANQSKKNKVVRDWAKGTQAQLVRNIHRMNIKQNYDLLEHLTDTNPKYSKSNGDVFKVRIPNTIGGIMTAYGEGRGSTKNRVPKDWYPSLMEARIQILADEVMELKGDEALTFIKYTGFSHPLSIR